MPVSALHDSGETYKTVNVCGTLETKTRASQGCFAGLAEGASTTSNQEFLATSFQAFASRVESGY